MTISMEGADIEALAIEVLSGSGRLDPHCVVIDCEHALPMEFGTSPAKKRASLRGGPPSKAWINIREWCRVRWGITDPRELDRRAGALYKRIMDNGLAPHPFIRPAMEEIREELLTLDGEHWFNEHSVEDLAEYLAERMREILIEHDTVFTGELLDSIHVTPWYGDEAEGIPELGDLWSDPSAGVNGRTEEE